MNSHEEAFVTAFVEPRRQERFLGFLKDPKKRRKLINEFDHLKSGFLSGKFMTRLQGTESLPPHAYQTLRNSVLPRTAGLWAGGLTAKKKSFSTRSRNRGMDLFCLVCLENWRT